jgi:hypothetical protein
MRNTGSHTQVPPSSSSKKDQKLLQAVLHAHAWLADLKCGRFSSIEELAGAAVRSGHTGYGFGVHPLSQEGHTSRAHAIVARMRLISANASFFSDGVISEAWIPLRTIVTISSRQSPNASDAAR